MNRLFTIFIIMKLFWETLAFFERNPIEIKWTIINCWILKRNIFTHWLPISALLGGINLNLSLILGLILIFSLTFGNKSKRENHLHARFKTTETALKLVFNQIGLKILVLPVSNDKKREFWRFFFLNLPIGTPIFNGV